ncbi:unnamed protein product, partial [Mesorhabditis spiculigera]
MSPTEAQLPPSGLVVPIVLWGKQPPRHRITAIRILSDRTTVITGADNGHIIIWKLQVDAICPHLLFLGHSASITAISPTSLLANSARLISVSADGQICLWDWLDGRCIDHVNGASVHRQMEPYASKAANSAFNTRIICAGDYADFIVLDPQDLTPVFTISSRVEPDWITAFTLVKRTNRADQILGFSKSGMVKIWTIEDLDQKTMESPLYEEESRHADKEALTAISFSSHNEKVALLISKKRWQVIDLDDLQALITFETQVAAVSGSFLEIDKVAVTYVDGSVRIYQLPLQALNGAQVLAQFGPSRQNYFGRNAPFEIAVLEGKKATGPLAKMQQTFAFEFALQREDQGGACQVIRASADGALLTWLIPRFGSAFIERVSDVQQLPLKYKGTFSESLAEIWSALNESPNPPFSQQDLCDVTASLYVGSQGKLLLGKSNGEIVMSYACETISKQLLDIPPERQNPRILHGHSGAVRAMLYPHEQSNRFDSTMMLSGGDDFSVIVWNINTAVRLYKFTVNGGSVNRFIVPPPNSSKQTLKCIAAVSSDNTVALLNIRDMKCSLLASRHPFKILDLKWRPLDDYMLVRLEDSSVYVWQIETASIERVVRGLQAEDILAACDEQIGVEEGRDEAGATQAVQLMRALKHRNIDAMKRVGGVGSSQQATASAESTMVSPMSFQSLPNSGSEANIVLFEVAALINGLSSLDAVEDTPDPKSISQLMGKQQNQDQPDGSMIGLSRRLTMQFESTLYLDIARLLLSCLHAWEVDADLDAVCLKKLGLHRPNNPLFYGNLSRHGHMAVVLPSRNKTSYSTFATDVRWQASHSLTTIHLLSVIATANTLMSMKNSSAQPNRRRSQALPLKRVPSKDNMNGEKQQMKQGWSLLAAMHCVLLPDNVRPKSSYAAPRIELLARRWQDGCLEIREAAQALLIRELNRLGSSGRKRLIESWAPYLPTLLDPSLSIFGTRQPSNNVPTTVPTMTSAPPPIPPRSNRQPLPVVAVPEPIRNNEGDHGVQQVRRNQATAIILLGVVGSEFGEELNKVELTRATAISLLELLVSPPTALLPMHSPLRRASIDLLGRGFTQWEPHLEISRVLIGLLDLASGAEKNASTAQNPVPTPSFSPMADAARTARHALSQIATARPPAMLTALSMEVARYNVAAQHQTIQHSVISPLLKTRVEVLRIIEDLSEKQYGAIVEMMLPVGDVLVHCLDTSLLKHKTLAEVFPPITKFYMVSYCPTSRRIAFGGRNGACVVHELRPGKAQTLQAHQGPVSAVCFSEDGKFLATYGAQDGKLNFWQTTQNFFGMGQSQMRCGKSLAAPTLPTVISPGGQAFRPRLVWINSKSLTLMLPEGREQRFTI